MGQAAGGGEGRLLGFSRFAVGRRWASDGGERGEVTGEGGGDRARGPCRGGDRRRRARAWRRDTGAEQEPASNGGGGGGDDDERVASCLDSLEAVHLPDPACKQSRPGSDPGRELGPSMDSLCAGEQRDGPRLGRTASKLSFRSTSYSSTMSRISSSVMQRPWRFGSISSVMRTAPHETSVKHRERRVPCWQRLAAGQSVPADRRGLCRTPETCLEWFRRADYTE